MLTRPDAVNIVVIPLRQIKMAMQTLLLAAVALTALQESPKFVNERVGISISLDKNWTSLSIRELAAINANTVRPVAMHAKKLDVPVKTKLFSKILLFQSRVPLGSNADNPNYLFAAEKAWTDKFEHTGKGYLDLMVDRVEKVGAPTKFAMPAKKMKIDGQDFFYSDAENSKVKDAKTKQRYICGFSRGHYIYFVLSYNDVNDADFKTMMSCINSIKFKE